MVWFSCDACGDSIKKPKLNGHRCGGATFTCVDCSMTFDRAGANGHTRCVTEHEKYALGATKPGGFAARGFADAGAPSPGNGGGGGGGGGAPSAGEVAGLEFLSTRPPWRCSACNVNCTSRETLLGHAAGQKHRRRARAAAAAANGGKGQQQQQQQEQAPATPPAGKAEQQQEEEEKKADKKAEKRKEEEEKAREEKQADSSSDSDSDSSSSDDDDGGNKEASKKRKRGGGDGEDNKVDAALLAKVLADARKKLAAKGKLKVAKLRALVAKRLKKQQQQKGKAAAAAAGGAGAVVEAAVAELQRAASADGSKRAKLSKDGEKLKMAS